MSRSKKIDLAQKSEIDLVNIIDAAEYISWRINHDAADGRIPNAKSVDKSIESLIKERDSAAEEIRKRANIKTDEELRVYIRGKLKERDELWDKQWAELYQEGAVFRISKPDALNVFETVRTYLATSGMFGPKQFILARQHDSGHFALFDDREITILKRLDSVPPRYQGMPARGIIKAEEEMDKRDNPFLRERQLAYPPWYYLTDIGTVFKHQGFNETFETFDRFNLPNTEKIEANEVILARSYSRPVFIEFTPRDIVNMRLSRRGPKYTRRTEYAVHIPRITLEK